ncbi:MAG: hypothetical protein AAFX54_01495 [Pseudomonadota bacterium]
MFFRRVFSPVFVCIIVSFFSIVSAQAQIVRMATGKSVPPDADWRTEAMSFCKSLMGDTEIEPIYVEGYLLANTARCGSGCFEPILKGEFEYLEMIIDKPADRTTVQFGSFWPKNGMYILTRQLAGHKSCTLFDEMMALMRQSKGWKDLDREYVSLLEKHCVGVNAVDKLKSDYGVRQAILFGNKDLDEQASVDMRGEEIFIVETGETHAAKYNVKIEFSSDGVFGDMNCSPRKNHRNSLNLQNAFKPLESKSEVRQ